MKIILSLLLSLSASFVLCVHAENLSDTFSLSSGSFEDQTALNKTYTCDGKDISPELHWSGVPEKTQSLALIMSDLDAPGGIFYHWVVYNIPKTQSAFPENMSEFPHGMVVAKNSWGKKEYNGPCPPKGPAHYYIFTLYALDTTLHLSPDVDAATVLNALQSHILSKAEVSATYGRSLK